MQNGVQWTLQKKRMTVDTLKSMYFSFHTLPGSHGKEASLNPLIHNNAIFDPNWLPLRGIFGRKPVRSWVGR